MLINSPYIQPLYLSSCAPHVATSTMRAIVITESHGNPLAINLNHGHKLKYQATHLAQAIAWVNYLETHDYNFDVGLAQININNIHRYGYRARDLLNPCLNLRIADLILQHDFSKVKAHTKDNTEALLRTLSAYNSGNYTGGLNNGYITKILINSNLIHAN
jgi:type IV secretion system protein VirB1